jgi:hypothetical protein
MVGATNRSGRIQRPLDGFFLTSVSAKADRSSIPCALRERFPVSVMAAPSRFGGTLKVARQPFTQVSLPRPMPRS